MQVSQTESKLKDLSAGNPSRSMTKVSEWKKWTRGSDKLADRLRAHGYEELARWSQARDVPEDAHKRPPVMLNRERGVNWKLNTLLFSSGN